MLGTCRRRAGGCRSSGPSSTGSTIETSDARLLVERSRSLPLPAHVNLIPLNPTPGYAVRGSPPSRVREFRDRLREGGVNATIRRTRGTEIDAACGQLRAAHEIEATSVAVRPRR